ncbi:MAG: DNA-binding transcriptional ArsR family regulator [Candidatus Krumholzibacteriia bacterium]|jgi:DNA-binding transcriptional ArsR family regulator
MSLNAVSKHLKALEQARLVRREIKGRVHHIHLNAAPMAEAERWVNQYRIFWEARLGSFETWLENNDDQTKEEK